MNITSPSNAQIMLLLENYQDGNIDDAKKLALSMNKKFPEHPFSWKVLGAIFEKQGKKLEALNANKRASNIAPNDVEALNNLGVTLKNLKKLEEAESIFKKAIILKNNYAEAHYNLGSTLKELGKHSEAENSFRQAIKINPNFVPAYNNLGNSLKELGAYTEAITNLSKAITLNPNYTVAYNNLGIILLELGKTKETIEIFNKAIAINPEYTEAYNSLGAAYLELGNKKEAIASFYKAISIKPNYLEAWNNLYFSIQIFKPKENYLHDMFKNNSTELINIHLTLLNHKLHIGEAQAEYYYNKAIKAIANENIQIQNPNSLNNNFKNTKDWSKKIIALLHFGRSGTGLLHSLIDNHSEVSTLPSIYFAQFFDSTVWKKLIRDGWANIIDNFIKSYPVLFDARSSYPIASKKGFIENIGIQEGMTTLGENKNEFLYVDKTSFKKELTKLISKHVYLDQITFFKLVHSAYEKSINNSKKNTLFYHIHNPDTNAKLSFINAAPNAKWLVMVRDPVKSCESWISEPFHKDSSSYRRISTRIVSMLFMIDTIEIKNKDAIGVRLEDLKNNPKKVIPALCQWMEIKEEKTLYEMTAQGKKWWGDSSAPNMPAFGKLNESKVGNIFSTNDRFVLNTLFYPFNVRFGYVEENLQQFKLDIKRVRPMLDQVFDFEKNIINRTKTSIEEFKKSGMYLYLRTRMIERWEILNKDYTYPNMLKSLTIK